MTTPHSSAGTRAAAALVRAAIVIAILPPAVGAAARAVEDASAFGPRPVETIEFRDLGDESRGGRKVPMKLHLPATGAGLPVVIVSHGAGGDLDTHLVQARHLASHDYAVCCVEHVGSNRAMLAGGAQLLKKVEAMTRDSREVLGRPRDVGFALDRAADWNLTHAKLRGRLDLDRVGMLGHSFGAYATLVACGARPALEWLTPPVAPGRGLGPDLRDRRVRCGVALSPQGVGEPFFIRESFASLAVPVLGITGSLDRQQGGLPAGNRREGFGLWPAGGHRLLWLAGARHLDFTDSTGTGRLELPSPTRADVQPVARAATLLFFDAHLRAGDAAATKLTAEALKPLLRGAVTELELLAK